MFHMSFSTRWKVSWSEIDTNPGLSKAPVFKARKIGDIPAQTCVQEPFSDSIRLVMIQNLHGNTHVRAR